MTFLFVSFSKGCLQARTRHMSTSRNCSAIPVHLGTASEDVLSIGMSFGHG